MNQTPEKGKRIVELLRWVTHEGQQYCEGLHFARLPQSLVGRLEKKLDLIKTK